jgi:hypothetical protein
MAKVYYEVADIHIRIAKESPANFFLICKMSLKSAVIKECLDMIYKDLMPLEVLPQSEKKDLWDYTCKEFSQYSKDDRIKLCKSVYVLGSLF